MPETSSCATAAGLCMHDPRCQDTWCPGHPVASCTTCTRGRCITPEACQVPLADLRPIERHIFTRRRRFELRLPTSRQGWGYVVMAGMGLAGMAFITGAVGRFWGVVLMRIRTITIVVKGGNHFDVHEGEGYADHLCWDEMLGCLAELTHPALCTGRARYFQRPEERDWHEAFRAERQAASAARRARVEAERSALPTLELRALHSFVELHAERDLHSSDEPLPLDQQRDPDVREAMRKLADAVPAKPLLSLPFQGTP